MTVKAKQSSKKMSSKLKMLTRGGSCTIFLIKAKDSNFPLFRSKNTVVRKAGLGQS